MSADALTRCPGCATVFRITAEQLALRQGQVRCGRCRAVFDANDHLVAEERVDLMPPEAEPETPPSHLRGVEAPSVEPPQAGRAEAVPVHDAPRVEPPQAGHAEAGPVHDAPRVEPPQAGHAEAGPAIREAPMTKNARDTPAVAAPGIAAPDEAAGAAIPADGAAVAPAPVEATGAATLVEAPDAAAAVDAAKPATPVEAAAAATPADAATPVEAPAAATSDEAADAATPDETAEDAAPAEAPAAEAPAAEAPAVERPPRYEWKPRKPVRERPALLYAAAALLLIAALALQLVLEYRDRLAAHAPFTRPILASACSLLGCTIAPLHDAAALSIDASDLQADPAHRGLLQLSATIRNRAAYAIAYPYLELTLTDASDQVVARRARAPRE
jgi:predicted Zn finger-like uncharacterized protein